MFKALLTNGFYSYIIIKTAYKKRAAKMPITGL